MNPGAQDEIKYSFFMAIVKDVAKGVEETGEVRVKDGVIVRFGNLSDEGVRKASGGGRWKGALPATGDLTAISHDLFGTIEIEANEGDVVVTSTLPMTDDARAFCVAWAHGMMDSAGWCRQQKADT